MKRLLLQVCAAGVPLVAVMTACGVDEKLENRSDDQCYGDCLEALECCDLVRGDELELFAECGESSDGGDYACSYGDAPSTVNEETCDSCLDDLGEMACDDLVNNGRPASCSFMDDWGVDL